MTFLGRHKSRPNGISAQNDAYHLYFSSGYYDRRYPAPNYRMWRRIKQLLGPDAAVLDFGCGNGRYTLRLQGLAARVIGYDVSPTALESLRARARQQDWENLHLLGPSPRELDAHIAAEGPVDLVLCLFGVLGHIVDPSARGEALSRMRRALDPEQGRLLISVPNRARRFRTEQSAKQSTLVQYERTTDACERVALSYQLFDPTMLVTELRAAGFSVKRLGCESVLPESWLLNHASLRVLDSLLVTICPTRWGYGIYAEAAC